MQYNFMKVLKTIVRDYNWIHLGVGLFGNLCFFVGSILFLWESTKNTGVWLFIIGSAGMLVGSAGRWITSLYARKEGME